MELFNLMMEFFNLTKKEKEVTDAFRSFFWFPTKRKKEERKERKKKREGCGEGEMKTFLKGLFQDVFGRLAPVALVLSTSVLGIFIFLSKEDGDEKYSVHLVCFFFVLFFLFFFFIIVVCSFSFLFFSSTCKSQT